MKKVLFIIVIAVVVAGFAAAQTIDIGDFPTGTWLDENYNAFWEFSSAGIIIKGNSDQLLWDFSEKGAQDFSITPSLTGITISWSCAEAGQSGKSYTIEAAFNEIDLVLTIKRAEYPDYTVTLTKVDM